MKYVRRKYAREYRKLGLPFVASKKLARLREKCASFELHHGALDGTGVEVEFRRYCDCCGEQEIILRYKDKDIWLNYWSLAPI